MNLSEMSLKDAVELHEVLEKIIRAAGCLAELPVRGEQRLAIDMAPGGPIVIVTHYEIPSTVKTPLAQPGDERFALADADARDEDVALVLEPVQSASEEVQPLAASANPSPRTAPKPVSSPVVTGPLSDDEKATVRDMAAKGFTASGIAKTLNRRTQTVALLLSQERRPKAETVGKSAAPAATPAKVAATAGKAAISVAAPPREPSAADASTESSAAVLASDLHGENLRIWQFLDALGYEVGFDAELDFDLVDGLAAGTKLGQLALDLDVDAGQLKKRFRALSECVLDRYGKVTIDGQQRLWTMLKARAIRSRKAA
ncbi:hypothetical protein [Paenirhodobacter populi]|uniref:Uncharacterized protein n=1 Tax=Paenirhodobacter populi TaxID=2306993 RepID=A0A443JE36_9RHOB|nr:hypothetical protein [Sinirhodobacter populi]RWR18815.1 hypothetical protein D2T30_15765 [Sinirhodobacter populi]